MLRLPDVKLFYVSRVSALPFPLSPPQAVKVNDKATASTRTKKYFLFCSPLKRA
jgi:hypothetical protein